ncbi:MAG: CDP-alcohol phosphatidyltransferase family protein [Bacteroidia bacterium]|nr:CDP-alcohol phosphatidyltransferase family protein [Bacteroidia bacterium]
MSFIPNTLTSLNLLCGCIGIVFAFQGNLVVSSWLIGLACVFDFLDGFTARLLNAPSAIGKQLDSLADMVTFGVLPGVIMFQLISFTQLPDLVDSAISFGSNLLGISVKEEPEFNAAMLAPFVAFLIPVFSALRLAKFNIDERQSDAFIGLPTPANALFIASFPLIYGVEAADPISGSVLKGILTSIFGDLFHVDTGGGIWRELVITTPVLMVICVIQSVLLVAPLKLLALKFKNYKWQDNEIRYILIAAVAALVIFFGYTGVPFAILVYILLSVVNNFIES